MCNKLKLKINSVSPCGVKFGYLPCGKCADCRASLRSQWVFRLRWELDSLVDKGWKIGFFTLTYNDSSLPHIPLYLFQSPVDYTQVACFNRSDVQKFIKSLRDWARKSYGVYNSPKDKKEGLRYMVCAEFGEHTQRPHYHGIVCFPPVIPERAMYNKVVELWTGLDPLGEPVVNPVTGVSVPQKGFVFPRYFDGGLDSHGYLHKPFICDSTKAAAVYASKYVCKDLAYIDYIGNYDFRDKSKVYLQDVDIEEIIDVDFDFTADSVELVKEISLVRKRLGSEPVFEFKLSDYMPFHLQSKSLGAGFLGNLSASQKLDYLKNGYGFIGDSENSPLPIYLKNKIIFNPVYVYDIKTHKRLVRRDCTDLFVKYHLELFDKKVSQVEEKFENFFSVDYWHSLGLSNNDLSFITSVLSTPVHFSPREFAELYLAYFGVPYEQCFDVPLYDLWFGRYDDNWRIANSFLSSGVLVDRSIYDMIHTYVNVFFNLFVKYDTKLCAKKMSDEREISRIDDFWRSME